MVKKLKMSCRHLLTAIYLNAAGSARGAPRSKRNLNSNDSLFFLTLSGLYRTILLFSAAAHHATLSGGSGGRAGDSVAESMSACHYW